MDKLPKKYYFIDESGDPTFYANRKHCIVGSAGFTPVLLLGMVIIEDKKKIRNAILQFMDQIRNDNLYNTLPCINNAKGWYLHASYDNLEVQIKFLDFLRNLKGFEFHAIIARKRLDVFHKKHNDNESEFYFDLVYHLLKNQEYSKDSFHQIILSARNKNTLKALNDAVFNAIDSNKTGIGNQDPIFYNCDVLQSRLTPELSIADYLLLALQRYILKGEIRFYKALEEKYKLIIDLYDFEKQENNANFYHSGNRFDINKASKFRTDGYH